MDLVGRTGRGPFAVANRGGRRRGTGSRVFAGSPICGSAPRPGESITEQPGHLSDGAYPASAAQEDHEHSRPDLVLGSRAAAERIEHTCRLFGQVPGWTAPRIRDPPTAGRRTWLLIACHTQRQLARPPATDLRRPWGRPAPPGRLTPRGSRNLVSASGEN